MNSHSFEEFRRVVGWPAQYSRLLSGGAVDLSSRLLCEEVQQLVLLSGAVSEALDQQSSPCVLCFVPRSLLLSVLVVRRQQEVAILLPSYWNEISSPQSVCSLLA